MLYCRRRDDESWRDCAIRYARRYGLEREVLEQFDAAIAAGAHDAQACMHALDEWDLLDYRDQVPYEIPRKSSIKE